MAIVQWEYPCSSPDTNLNWYGYNTAYAVSVREDLQANRQESKVHHVVLDGLVVIVPVTRPKDREFKYSRGRWILRPIKIGSTTSLGWEVKPSAPCCEILRNVKVPCGV
jgi:hypothetical protein